MNMKKCYLFLIIVVSVWFPLVLSQDTTGCNFAIDTCEMYLNASRFGHASWRRGTGETAIYLGGPTTDADDTIEGGYGLVTVTDMLSSQPREAWILTKPADATEPRGRCLTFAYAVGELGVQSLKVLLLTYTTPNVIEALENTTLPLDYRTREMWEHPGTTNGIWRQAHVTFSNMDIHSLVFSASYNTRFTSHRGYVAIDNIAFSEGPCNDDCMFDKDFCTWENTDDDDEFNWSIGRSSAKRGTGPSKDQAAFLDSSISTGGYAYIDSGPPRLPEERARLISRELQPSDKPRCLRFWVNMNGGGLGHLRVLYEATEGNTTSILWQMWESNTSGTDTWHPSQQTVASSVAFRLVFEASVRMPGAGDLAIDTITLSEGACPSLPSGLKSATFDCTFLEDMCKWTSEPSNGTSLSRVPSNAYNPPGHTQSVYKITDMYMRFDLRCFKCASRSSEALLSPSVTLDTPHCLSFWVLMYTTIAYLTHVGALKVVLMYPDRKETVWHLKNQQHADWTYSQVTIPASDSPVRVSIEGVQGPHVMGMMAIDDIALFPLSCPLEPEMAKVEAGDCTFDRNLCDWQVASANSSSYLAKWHLANNNGIKDHTFDADSGGYAYMETFRDSAASNMTSPTLSKDDSFCLTFWFSPIYKDVGARLSVHRVIDSTQEDLLWTFSQSLNDGTATDTPQWRYAQLPLDNFDSDYKVVIVGLVTVAGWAVDDIRFVTNKDNCRVLPAKAEP